MKNYLKHHEWEIIEEGFNPHYNKISESVFSIGNGRMGQRANFEEDYSGETLRGSYVAGVYYPDKTRVGWWKNGYPEYFAKVLNSVNWIGVNITINGSPLDLHTTEVTNFKRILDMQRGVLIRTFEVQLPGNEYLSFSFHYEISHLTIFRSLFPYFLPMREANLNAETIRGPVSSASIFGKGTHKGTGLFLLSNAYKSHQFR